MSNLYMFALMMPEELAKRIDVERHRFAEKYNCVKALKPPVHITMFEPFTLEDTIGNDLVHVEQWVRRQTPMEVELKDFAFFENQVAPVIFINVIKNAELSKLHKGFSDQLTTYVPVEKTTKVFKPHVTIGYRDVSPAIFPQIQTEYSKRKFEGKFTVKSIYLWRHDSKSWQIQRELKLSEQTVEDKGIQASLF